MKLKTISIAAFTALALIVVARSGDEKERSAEFQVLGQFTGTWDTELTIKVPGKEVETAKGTETRSWSRGGNFVRFENSEAAEFHMLLTYDPAAKNYPGVIMAGTFRTLITGTWDADEQTMEFTATFPDGNRFKSSHKFTDARHAVSSSSTTSPDGKILMERVWKQTKRRD